MIDRRTVLGTLGLVALGPSAVASAQAGRTPRVGFLGAESPSTSRAFLDAFRDGLRAHGRIEGRDVTIEERWAEGRSERFPALVTDLLGRRVAVIVAISTPAALAAKHGTSTVPIVFVAGDPAGSGLVTGLARPGGNLTGVSLSLGVEFTGKWLELLREAVPTASLVAVLWNPDNPSNVAYLQALELAAPRLRLRLRPEPIRDPDQLGRAFEAMVAAQVQALVVLTDPLTVRHRVAIVEQASQRRLPAVYGFREFVDAGGLMAYGVSVPEMCRRAAGYVDRILKGARPGDLPVDQPTAFQLVVNLRTAASLGLTIGRSLLLRADDIIQ